MIYRAFLALALLFSVGWSIQPVQGAQSALGNQSVAGAIYTSPLAGAAEVNPETTITVRLAAKLSAAALASAQFVVSGSQSGSHVGRVVLADDGVTVVFKPVTAFSLGETVQVSVQADGAAATTFDFHVRARPQVATPNTTLYPNGLPAGSSSTQPVTQGVSQISSAVTYPADLPIGDVTTAANGAGDGYIFTGNFSWPAAPSTYLMIIDNSGQPVYYQKLTQGMGADFKKQPNGLLTYFDAYLGMFIALNSSYQVVDTFQMVNGYSTDVHDLQILPNGHTLMMSYDSKFIDMTSHGGNANAVVIGLIIQEQDARKNVIFEWRSWDHMQYTDSYVPLTTATVDYIHGNAVELDQDGNILISSRHIHEITKIDRQTGAFVWRMGGKNNQFNFTDDPGMFHWQHDVRRLPNGNITLFDNNTLTSAAASRALEYAVDEKNMTVTTVTNYVNQIPQFSFAMGSNQRLPNGNSLIGWGSKEGSMTLAQGPSITEVKPDGTKAFEMMFPAPIVSYRSFRFPWHGNPAWAPTLVLQNKGMDVNLYYSWNGATEISSYKVYASKRNQAVPNDLIAVQPKTGFENSTTWTNGSDPYCYFRIMPVDNLGHETQASAVVLNPICFQTLFNYLPYITNLDLPALGRR